jgi:hypothetical protein
MAAAPQETLEAEAFLLEAKLLLHQAEGIAQKFPDVEASALEQAIRQLYATRKVLTATDDPFLEPEEIDVLVGDLSMLINQLRACEEGVGSAVLVPPPAATCTGKQGRRALLVDLDECDRLHGLGNSWGAIAEAHGITRQTLHSQFKKANRNTARKAYTNINDGDLDELVSSIALDHPFIGQRIMKGHLESMGVHVPVKQIQESLKRVDEVGVLARSGSFGLPYI